MTSVSQLDTSKRGHAPFSASSPKSAPRTPINPDIMELLAELAVRFPKGGDGSDDDVRLRLLAEDLSDTMGPGELTAAIREWRKVWRFLPTLAEIIEAGTDYRAERRDARKADDNRRIVNELRALPAPEPLDADEADAQRAAMMRDLAAKIDAGTQKLRGTSSDDPIAEPLTWRLQREAGGALLPQTIALRDAMRDAAQ